MADFSFLNDDQQDEAVARKPAQQAPVYTPLSDDTGESEGMGQSPGQTPEVHDEGAANFQKKRAQAADFAKSEATKGIDRLAAQLKSQPDRVYPFNAEEAKSKLYALHPSKYAQHLEGLVNQALNTPGMVPPPVDPDTILRPVEDAVTNYKRLELQQQPQQAQGIQQQLSEKDAPMVKNRIVQLDHTILQTQQDMAIAATSRQKQELANNLQFFQAQKSQLQAKLPPETEMGEDPVDKNLNMNAVLTSAGWDRKDFIQANTEVRRIVGTHGINPTDPVTPSTFPIIVPKIIEEVFKPEQAMRFYEEINGKPEDQQKQKQDGKVVSDELEKDPRFKDMDSRIQQSESRHDAVWRELAHSGNFNNVGDVIGFVLTSLVLGPRAGAALFSNMNKNGSLRNELMMIDHETTQLYHRQNSYIQLSMHARQQALNEEHQKEQLQETNRHNYATEGIQYGRMKALADKIPDDGMRKIAAVRLHGLRMAESNLRDEKANLDRMEKAMSNPMDPRAKVAKAALMQQTKDYAIKVQQMQKYRADLQKWFENNADKVGGVMFPGTALNKDNFQQSDE